LNKGEGDRGRGSCPSFNTRWKRGESGAFHSAFGGEGEGREI